MSTTTVQINLENQQNHLQDKTANEFLKADEIPEWLSENFFENILRKYFKNDKLKVKSLQIKQCGGKGDSYASTMFRVGTFVSDGILTENSKFQSFIVKSLPDNENAMDKLGSNNYDVQNKEMEMYEKILPKFSKLLEAVNEDSDFFPKVIAVNRVLQVIVLEDLAERKFKMADRLKGLDLDHILMTLRKLARMHAASVMVHSENPKAFSHLDTGLFTRKTDCFHNMFESLCECFIEEVATWEGFEYYATKLEQVRKNLIKNAQRAFDCDDGDLHVLNHGDLWTNNQLFEYDEAGNPIESVLLDFQFSAFGSPALDLIVSGKLSQIFFMKNALQSFRPKLSKLKTQKLCELRTNLILFFSISCSLHALTNFELIEWKKCNNIITTNWRTC